MPTNRGGGRIRTQLSSISKISSISQERGRSTKSGLGRHPVRQAVFSLSPQSLRELLEMGKSIEDVDQDAPSDETDESEHDSDLKDVDDDEYAPDSDSVYDTVDFYAALFGETPGLAESPILSLENVYVLGITKDHEGLYRCTFESPSWFKTAKRGLAADYVEKLNQFLSACAAWIEEHKQEFLKIPTAENYVVGEFSPDEPSVLQKGALARVNAMIGSQDLLEESDFSRLVDKIWLLWPEWNMPLRQLFSPEFRTAWVVQSTIAYYKENSVQRWELGDSLTASALKRAKTKDFGNLSLEERFHVLCDLVSINASKTFEIVEKELRW